MNKIKFYFGPNWHLEWSVIRGEVEIRILIFANHETQAGYNLVTSWCSRTILSKYSRPKHHEWDKVSHYGCFWLLILGVSSMVLGWYYIPSNFVLGVAPGRAAKSKNPRISKKAARKANEAKKAKEARMLPSYFRETGSWDFTGVLLRNQRRWLHDSFLRMVRAASNRTTVSWPKVLWYFTNRCFKVVACNGLKGLVIWLKVNQLILMQSVAGQKVQPRELGCAVARNRSGVPRIIPRIHRERIRQGDVQLLKIWLSLLSLYRVINFPGILKLETITEPGVLKFIPDNFASFLGEFYYRARFFKSNIIDFINNDLMNERERFRGHIFVPSWVKKNLEASPFIIKKAGPLYRGTSTHPWGIILTAWLWFRHDVSLWMSMTKWLDLTGNKTLAMFMMLSNKTLDYIMPTEKRAHLKDTGYLGKLSIKPEPAGKLRVFAIVDCWTQWLFYPLHKAIQQLLKSIPQDGTFDQVKPVELLISRLGGSHPCFSYDLSAATDRLPILIQEYILSPFLGTSLAQVWSNILSGRAYKLPNLSNCNHALSKAYPKLAKRQVARTIKYATGQPMGALSSWVLLALTHHFIVQLAAWECGYRKWFSDYAVLGDDIVIMSPEVANRYYKIMTVTLGVKINESKSLISTKYTTLEFAKKYWYKGVNATPLSFKELNESRTNISVWLEMKRKYALSNASLMFISGAKKSINRHLLKFENNPILNLKTHADFGLAALFWDKWKLCGDWPTILLSQLKSLFKEISYREHSWTRELDLPTVLRLDPKRQKFSESFVMSDTDRKTSTFVVNATNSWIYDLFSFLTPQSILPRRTRYGWALWANQRLYGKDVGSYLTQLETVKTEMRYFEDLISSLKHDSVSPETYFNHIEINEQKVAAIPKEYSDLFVRSEEDEGPRKSFYVESRKRVRHLKASSSTWTSTPLRLPTRESRNVNGGPSL